MAVSVNAAVADVQEAVAEQVAEAQEAALENAAEQIAVAERVAETANDALLMTTLGQRISVVENEAATWKAENSSLRMEVQALAGRVAELAQPPVIVAPAPSSIPPQPSPPQPEGINPADQVPEPEPSAGADGPEKTVHKAKRRLL